MKQNNKLSGSIVTSLNLSHFDLPKQQVTLIVLRNTEKNIRKPSTLSNKSPEYKSLKSELNSPKKYHSPHLNEQGHL